MKESTRHPFVHLLMMLLLLLLLQLILLLLCIQPRHQSFVLLGKERDRRWKIFCFSQVVRGTESTARFIADNVGNFGRVGAADATVHTSNQRW